MQLNPARKAAESFPAYQKRRVAENAMVRQHLKGRLVIDCGVQFVPHPVTGVATRTKGHPFGRAY